MTSSHRVIIVDEAEQDLAQIVEYIALRDSLDRADLVLARLLEVCESLERNPQRGPFLHELLPLGIRDFREIHFKPYRIIYQIIDRDVLVQLFVDQRRSLQSLLEQRLLR